MSSSPLSRRSSVTAPTRPPGDRPRDDHPDLPTGAAARAPGSDAPLVKRRMTPGRRRRIWRDTGLFFLLIAPNLLAILVFSYWPSVYNIVLSFMDWNLLDPFPEWVGLANYKDVFADPDFWTIILNTVVFTGVTVAGSLVGGLALGSLLATRVRFTGLVRTFAFAPHMLPGAAVGMLWLFMFDPNYGLSRFLFGLFGADSPQWTTTSDWSLWALTIAYLWQRLGFVTVIYYTAILDLPQTLYEAAALDGAHGWRMLRHITLPLLSPITFFLSVTGVIASAQAFDLISIMTGGGPGISSSTLSWMVYEEAFQNFDIGRASAAATTLFALLLMMTFIQVRFSNKRVNYAS
ncbi:glycerol-3-phosphate ABC transporter permease [Brachybacterium endophyticum]|uniref:Glycerol-3-phosphate ABC transporter permease n=1 Tax=Brachybacterium endophyticum TaxID=2182385 RepID=A0A2U2RLM8_9MICO|nr:sugar ABC transporter permease [Brachybacterium endophyticum]PWH06772.1 glycerol-3-phosphate ABC transporter permease [Brachybacterium endophyticum]